MEITTHAPPQIAASLARARSTLVTAGASDAIVAPGMEAAELVASLTLDEALAVATLLHGAQRAGFAGDEEMLNGILGPAPVKLAVELARLGELGLPAGWSAQHGLNPQQAETLRKMLLAIAADPRLIVARLAEQLVRLRAARDLPEAERQRLATETREIFAPLANRLGVWTVKWELEDQSFRYLEPEEYRRIATALAERRVDRERYIEEVCALLSRELSAAGISATVYGRPKHIFSIWRKMQRKHVGFEQVFDVRAVRIVVESISDCYAALGIVHGLWPYIPGEFDDYIATPKGNEYRSIHTAVIGPEHKSLEIQIRSRDMHEHAELGVAAHWRYKEGGAPDHDYARKIEWVRRMLDPATAEDAGDFIESVRGELFADRVYALTPRGEVVDLPRGATPLDFAYHLHTNLGHRCRGAKINGRIVPLTQALESGQIVEIITGREAAPSRDWLLPAQGYLVSPRSRAKVRAWFRRHDETDHRNAGRALLERELAAAGVGSDLVAPLVRELHADSIDDLHAQLGAGDISAAQLAQALTRVRTPALPELAPTRRRRHSGAGRSPVEIEGVGDLPITMARCCGPMPPEPIAGYVTLGRGVTIHRIGCPQLVRMRTAKPERVLNCDWSEDSGRVLPVQIRVEAFDRRGLLRDVSDVMALEKLSIDGVNSNTDPADRIATIVMRTAVRDTEQLGRVLQRLSSVPNVLKSERVG
jgi:GTP pyrophosphokinase